jgi:hypothetical protein
MKLNKNLIGLAGEMRVCSELLKRGLSASITFGNTKATDVIVIGQNNRFLRIEVKTSQNGRNFVTGYYPKYSNPTIHPDIWVFYLPCQELTTTGDRFFIATHEEVGELQLCVNKGKKTEKGKGCDNIPLKFFVQSRKKFEERWDLFAEELNKK